MAGIDLDAVAELDQAAKRVEEALGALARLDREVRSGRVPDEERVAGQHEPGIRPSRAVDDGETAVLGPVAGCVDAAEHDVADGDLVAVLHRIVRILRLGRGVDAHRDAVLERQPAVAGEVVCMGVRLDRSHDANAAMLRLDEVLLDREGRIHDDRGSRALVADEVGGAAEVVVDELREDHVADDASTASRYRS